MREVHCLHYFEFIFLTVWPYGLDSGPALEIHSNSLSRRTVSNLTFCVSYVQKSDLCMKDIKYTCKHASSLEAD